MSDLTEVITKRDIIAMVVLCSALDPANYPKPAAKSMIYQAKAIMEGAGPDGEVYFRIQL